MDKRYQIFISSTYTDLQEERQKVLRTLLEMNCIPAGMELFPAADEEQFEFIKKVIDDCDYYILIIGGRYGSLTESGISYTEKEYDYAIEKGIKVIALIHGNPSSIPIGKSEVDQQLRDKLDAFRDKVSTGRIVKKWENLHELPGLVALSLTHAIKTYPATGWVRANITPSTELLQEINELRKANNELQKIVSTKPPTPKLTNLASGNEPVNIYGTYYSEAYSRRVQWTTTPTWNDILFLIGPHLLIDTHDAEVRRSLTHLLFKLTNLTGENIVLDDIPFQTIKIQLMALDLVNIRPLQTQSSGTGLFWILTEEGKQAMVSLRAIRHT